MTDRFQRLALALMVVAMTTPLLADDLTGSNQILCTAVQSTRCLAETGECITAPPWTLNVPQFILIDLEGKKLATTAASGENRSTPIKNIERADGTIYLQGVEGGRAFSFVIVEATGMASIAVATDGSGISIFGACTPVPEKQ